MHRRVAQTVAAVLPHRASQRPWDPDSEAGEIAAESPEGPTLDDNAYTDLGFARMSSPVDSIASGPRSSPDAPQEEQDGADDDNDDVEWELQNNGLYIGSYFRVLLLNACVPVFAVVTFAVLALLPDLAWPIADFPSTYPASFPFPLPEILLSSAFFSQAHLLRVPLFSFASLLLPAESACLASTFLHVLITNGLRLAALAILQVRHTMDYPIPTCQDPAFRTVWWLSLNFAEVLAAIVQGYQQLALYRDVMVPEGREIEFLERLKSGSLDETVAYSPEQEAFEDELEDGEARSVESRIDRGVEKLLVIKMREELEEVYGLPVIKIPVIISCLQRFNSIILSIGLNLLLSAAYLRSPLSIPTSDQFSIRSYISSHVPFVITTPLVLLLHASLAALHTPAVLPRIGVHTAAYVGVLVGIMSFFAGLAVWGALS
ncbi:hypothetical protein DEU56DRAFT_918995 [Suillus clintonianus]|uniref:uncharacterized protein n=1 Tax=Suillus clintonianus TaxID=1904413 RepID=UPI001B886C40|nr:uncharacterized protein DEU56DRAFT_918995 [Suillus clintonianus]KAG2117731.1 hypothetical protein DEU56DRAFT_918995 [Suillus clintonianus]